MSSLITPRYELKITLKDGNTDRDWYRFFSQLGKSQGSSLSSMDDQLLTDAANNAASESLGLVARQLAIVAQAAAAAAQASANSALLMAYWPMDQK